jgi:hypothetical protein
MLEKQKIVGMLALKHSDESSFEKEGHPPAGAITLIVSLGIILKPGKLVIVEAAVFLHVVQAFVINRLAGLPCP